MNDSLYIVSNALQRLASNERIDADILAEKHDGEEHALYREVYDKLDDAYQLLRYLQKPVRAEYSLFLNENGRYEVDSGHYYTSGSQIEFYYDGRWELSRVESHDGEYCILHFRDVDLDGLRVRIR